jgi:hypothetical protein
MSRGQLSVFLVCAALLGCGDDDRKEPVTSPDGGSADASAVGRDAASSMDSSAMDAARDDGGPGSNPNPGDGSTPFVFNDAGQVLCGNVPCACSDGKDNDTDGVFDTFDPECVSAWDNDESSFATGISGDNRDDACQDCFFDGNSGSGDDGCRVPSSCLTTGMPTSGQGGCNSCTASTECTNFCRAYTPNGCDCFGCCAVQLGSNVTKNVLLGAGCNIDGTNVTGCTECVPSVSCVNTCGRCELCPGKTANMLPADCGTAVGGTPDAGVTPVPTPTCDQGEARCGVGLPGCGVGEACSFGCCLPVPAI